MLTTLVLVLGACLVLVLLVRPATAKSWWGLAQLVLVGPAVMIGILVLSRVMALPRQRRMRANVATLGADPVSVRLCPSWSDGWRGVQLRFQVRPEGEEQPVGSVRFLYDPRSFDPRGTFAMSGGEALGAPVAFRSNERDLTLVPIAPLEANRTAREHRGNDLVNQLLGWREHRAMVRVAARGGGGAFRAAPIASPTTDDLLLSPVPASLRRAKRAAWLRLVVVETMVLVVCTATGPPAWVVVGAVVVAVCLRGLVWPRAGTRWAAAPLAEVVGRREAIAPVEADFVARALLEGGFPRCVANRAQSS